MDKLLFQRILVAALTLLAVVYVAYLLISANFDMYPTENAVQTTVTDKIYSNAFIIRDENLIENTAQGVLSYSVANGEAVNANGEIAKVYANAEDALAHSTAEALQKKKESLEYIQKNTISGTMNIDIINNNIKNKLINYLDDTNNGNISKTATDADTLLTYINQRMLYTGKIGVVLQNEVGCILRQSFGGHILFVIHIVHRRVNVVEIAPGVIGIIQAVNI